MQSLCTLRNHRRQWPRNTRYQADATPYLGRTSTGWIAPALPGALTQSPRRQQPYPAAMGLQIEVLNTDTSAEISAAFEAFGRDRPDAIFVATSPFLNGRRAQLAQLAALYSVPPVSTRCVIAPKSVG
jgi:hypothetical protein